MSKKRILAIIGFFIAGIIFFSYPYATDLYSRWQQNILVADYKAQFVEIGDENSVPSIVPSSYNGMMVLEISKIDLTAVVLPDTTQGSLSKGPGWYPESALPGKGNTAIAGHRTMYGAWFNRLNELKKGDTVRIEYLGSIYTYKIKKIFPVDDHDWSIIEPTEKPSLTLTTCHPIGSARERLVVTAELTTTGLGRIL